MAATTVAPNAAATLLLAAALVLALGAAPAAATWYGSGVVFCNTCWTGTYNASQGDAYVKGATVQSYCLVNGAKTSTVYTATTDSNGYFEVLFDWLAPFQNKFQGCFVKLVSAPSGSSCSVIGSCSNGDTTGDNIQDSSGNCNKEQQYNVGPFCLKPASLDSTKCKGAGVKGDPHFTGADSVAFDFTGAPGNDYCMVTDERLQVNMHLDGRVEGPNTYSWIKQLGVLSDGHSVVLAARGGAEPERGAGYMHSIHVDGRAVRLAEGERFVTRDAAVALTFLGHGLDGDDDVDRYELSVVGVADLVLKLRPEVPELRTAADSYVHFSVDMVSAVGLSSNPHGVLGQTFRADQKDRHFAYVREWSPLLQVWQVAGPDGNGYLDGEPEDYLTSSLLATDCKFSRFGTSKTTTRRAGQHAGASSRKMLL